jgi:hypothetical protein
MFRVQKHLLRADFGVGFDNDKGSIATSLTSRSDEGERADAERDVHA